MGRLSPGAPHRQQTRTNIQGELGVVNFHSRIKDISIVVVWLESLTPGCWTSEDLVNVVELESSRVENVQREGLAGQHGGGWEDSLSLELARLRAVAVSDVDIEHGAHRGVPRAEAAELRGQVGHLTPPVGSVLTQEPDNPHDYHSQGNSSLLNQICLRFL